MSVYTGLVGLLGGIIGRGVMVVVVVVPFLVGGRVLVVPTTNTGGILILLVLVVLEALSNSTFLFLASLPSLGVDLSALAVAIFAVQLVLFLATSTRASSQW